jgi:hypothetical protein
MGCGAGCGVGSGVATGCGVGCGGIGFATGCSIVLGVGCDCINSTNTGGASGGVILCSIKPSMNKKASITCSNTVAEIEAPERNEIMMEIKP